jgi:uncharacterized protein RhaS with RHS repeats
MFYRGYDPAIGRMLQVDPYATMYASVTTYNYALNNPAFFNDPYGGQAEGPYAEFWNTVLAGVKAKAWEAGWYGGSWSEDGGENLFDANEMYSFIDSQKDVPVLEILNYDTWDSGNDAGVGIRLVFRNADKKYKDVRWVQTVRTNTPQEGVTSPYNDPEGEFKDDDLPFFWTNAENEYHINYDGTDATFEDEISRSKRRNTYWQGELSAVSKQSDGTYAPIVTITYGFIINAKMAGVTEGGVSKFPLIQNVTPSQFHLSTFMNKNF